MDNNHRTLPIEHWTFTRELFKGKLLDNGFSDRDNFFAHYVFPFVTQKSATISLKNIWLKNNEQTLQFKNCGGKNND